MTLVERFIEVNRRPTSRKTALLAGIALPTHLAVWLIAYHAFRLAGSVDLHAFDVVMAAGAVALSISGLLGAVVARAGSEGRWTAYLLSILYGAFIGALICAMGTFSTIQFAWYPAVVILIAMYFDERLGWFGLIYGLVIMAVITTLHVVGAIPYAFAIRDHSIDAAQGAGWIVANFALLMVSFVFCFVVGLLAISARKLQDARLADAHQMLAQSSAQLERSNQLIRRYVPAQVAEAALTLGEGTDRHERRKLTLFFSDIVGFTQIAEDMDPEDLSQVLNDYFSEMNVIADRHGGTVDELMGDAILILFGAPTASTDRDHALRAVRMAVDMQAAMQALNARWAESGIEVSLMVRMGIDTGVVTIGNFGSPNRMKYAALGKHVNLAARLQTACTPGRILISQSTWLLVNDEIPCNANGEMQLKGLHRPVQTYEVAAGA